MCYSLTRKIINQNLIKINPLNAELNHICHLLALLGVHHFLHVSRIRVKSIFIQPWTSGVTQWPSIISHKFKTVHLSFNYIRYIIFNFLNLLVTWCTNSLTFNNCTLCPHCIYVLCIYLRTNNDLYHLQHKLIGFYNRDEKCLQRGTDWVFK